MNRASFGKRNFAVPALAKQNAGEPSGPPGVWVIVDAPVGRAGLI